METFLGWWFVGSIVAAGWGYRQWLSGKITKREALDLARKYLDAFNDAANKCSSWQTKYEDLVIEIQKRALTPTPSKPQNQVRKAKSYAEIRKANQVAQNEADRLAAEREANTAFEE